MVEDAMKTDTSGIDLARLARRLRAEYGLPVASVRFLPKGEEANAFIYLAVGKDGAQHAIRAQRGPHAAGQERAYTVTAALHTERGLHEVVAPYRTAWGRLTFRHAGFRVAVFPFIEGPTAHERPLSDQGIAHVAAMLAALHRPDHAIAGTLPPRERFHNPFTTPILRALRPAAEQQPVATTYQRRVSALLLAEQADLRDTLSRFTRLGAAVRRLDLARVITHGDPNLDNTIVGPDGGLHLIDWGEVALGPPERDLFAFSDQDRFELFLRAYVAAGGTSRLHDEVFAFYVHRWVLQEIADYTTRILLTNTAPTDDEHAWTELMPYLPIRRAEIEASVRRIGHVLRRVADG